MVSDNRIGSSPILGIYKHKSNDLRDAKVFLGMRKYFKELLVCVYILNGSHSGIAGGCNPPPKGS